jgi:hypothetical protein
MPNIERIDPRGFSKDIERPPFSLGAKAKSVENHIGSESPRGQSVKGRPTWLEAMHSQPGIDLQGDRGPVPNVGANIKHDLARTESLSHETGFSIRSQIAVVVAVV